MSRESIWMSDHLNLDKEGRCPTHALAACPTNQLLTQTRLPSMTSGPTSRTGFRSTHPTYKSILFSPSVSTPLSVSVHCEETSKGKAAPLPEQSKAGQRERERWRRCSTWWRSRRAARPPMAGPPWEPPTGAPSLATASRPPSPAWTAATIYSGELALLASPAVPCPRLLACFRVPLV